MFTFISHSTSDDILANLISQKLTKLGADNWVDHFRIKPGDDWDNLINQALKEASAGLLLLSQKSANSRECINEWRYILDLGKPLYVALIDKMTTEDFPYRLRTTQYVDLTEDFDKGLKLLAEAIIASSNRTLPVAKEVKILPPTKTPMHLSVLNNTQLKVFIETDFDKFDNKKVKEIVGFIAELAHAGIEQIQIVDVSPGSVVLTFETPLMFARAIRSHFNNKSIIFAQYGITDIKIKSTSSRLLEDAYDLLQLGRISEALEQVERSNKLLFTEIISIRENSLLQSDFTLKSLTSDEILVLIPEHTVLVVPLITKRGGAMFVLKHGVLETVMMPRYKLEYLNELARMC